MLVGMLAVGVVPVVAGVGGHVDLGADDRPDSPLLAGLVEFEGAEHGAVVGEGHRRHAVLPGLRDQVVEPDGAVEQ